MEGQRYKETETPAKQDRKRETSRERKRLEREKVKRVPE